MALPRQLNKSYWDFLINYLTFAMWQTPARRITFRTTKKICQPIKAKHGIYLGHVAKSQAI